jgi:arsenate reductase (thioredoxin)
MPPMAPEDEADADSLAGLRAVADPLRWRILQLLADERLCVAHLVEETGATQSLISHHLQVLRRAGLVETQRFRYWTYYRLRPPALAALGGRFARLAVAADTATVRQVDDPSTSPSEPGAPTRTSRRPAAAELLSDVEAVLRRAATQLAFRFQGVFSVETVERYLRESHQLLAPHARRMPLLTVRFATERLDAAAKLQRPAFAGKPEVLFVCAHNAGRSQLAAVLLQRYAGDAVVVHSAGSAPADAIHPAVSQVLAEVGCDAADAYPKPLTDEVVRAADIVVTMGCGDACAVYPGIRYYDWTVPDPAGAPIQQVRTVRDEIDLRVRNLLAEVVPTLV